MNSDNPFKAGDKVKGKDSEISGVVCKILSEEYVMMYEENFDMDMDIHVNELVLVEWQAERISVSEIKDEEKARSAPLKNPTIDLHYDKLPADFKRSTVFELEAQLNYFSYCLENALRQACSQITFIHGKGQGRLKEELLKRIRSDKRIKSWKELKGALERSHGICLRT